MFSNQQNHPMFPFMQNQAPVGQYPSGNWSNVNPPLVAHNSPLQNNLNVSIYLKSQIKRIYMT